MSKININRRNFIVGLSSVSLGAAGCVSSGDTGGASTPTATPTATPTPSFSRSGEGDFPTYSGTLSISGDDDYWSFKIRMDSSFGLRYTVRNAKSEDYDFDAFVFSPEQYGHYLQEIRDTGPAIEEIDALSAQGVRADAQRSGELDAGTYYFVVDNTDIGDAGDFGSEETREVTVDLETYDPAEATPTPTETEAAEVEVDDTETTRVEELKDQYPNWAYIDGQTYLVVLKPIDASADSYSVRISGTIVNGSDTDYDYAQVSFGLYTGSNGTGAKVGNAVDNLSGLEAGQKWRFEAVGSADDAASFEIEDTSAY